MNAFLLSCVFSVENKCLEATGLGQVQQTSVELCSIKKVDCAVQEYPSRGRDRDMGSITLTKSLLILFKEVAIQMNGYVAIALGQVKFNIALHDVRLRK